MGNQFFSSPKEDVKMLYRRLFSLLIGLMLIFGTAGSGLAGNSQPVGSDWCDIFWSDSNDNGYEILGQGQLSHNDQSNVWNVSCKGAVDFSQPPYTFEDFCASIPGSCKDSTMVVNHLDYYHLYYDNGNVVGYLYGLAHLTMHANGSATWEAQIADKNCSGDFLGDNVTYELPAGYWEEGQHTYTIHWYNNQVPNDQGSFINFFEVRSNAPLYHGQVRFGLSGGSYMWSPITVINPAQDTLLQASTWVNNIPYFLDYPATYATFSIDGGPAVTIQAGPVHNFCSVWHINFYLRTWGNSY
jgi:hypothetical protein